MAFAADLRHVLHLAEMQAVGGADRGTGGLHSRVDPLLAVVALDHLAGFGVPLGGAPRAGGDTGLAAHAQALLDVDDAVSGPFAHGAGGAGGDTPGIFAMEAGHEHVRGPRQPVHHFGCDVDHLTGLGADRQRLVALAGDFTGVASDAVFRILKQVILAHSYRSSLCRLDGDDGVMQGRAAADLVGDVLFQHGVRDALVV